MSLSHPHPHPTSRRPRSSRAAVAVALTGALLALALGNVGAGVDARAACRATDRKGGTSSRDQTADIHALVEFDSPPPVVRRAILRYIQSSYPQAVPYLKWDAEGTSLSASNLGASGSILLSGSGPTLVEISGDIGFPASLFVSEKTVRQGLTQAIRDIKKKTS